MLACALTKHGHFWILPDASQRWMRVEPDRRGMCKKLSHGDLGDLRRKAGDGRRERRGGAKAEGAEQRPSERRRDPRRGEGGF